MSRAVRWLATTRRAPRGGGYVEDLNKHLNRWEQVKRFAIIDRELTVEAGDLTPSLKLKRKVVVDNFHDRIDALYA